jgi:DNA-binding MarR family transcriptional regulator/N-acetylglutamate synthase-like GNAT family acetyltransferase
MTAVEEVRRFNRFYTRQIGLLDEHLSNSRFSLPEARVLFELAAGSVATAADLSRALGMDKSHLSRILARFRSQGLIRSRVSPEHAKHRLLSLTRAGRQAFAALEQGTVRQLRGLLSPLDVDATNRLTQAMQGIQSILSGARARPRREFVLRPLRVGDLGWIVHRQAVLYGDEYGWDWSYEALIAGILAEFVAKFDPTKEQAWIAEHAGRIAGSVFLVRGGDPLTAKLRLLYVEPIARGMGIGTALVKTCIDRARAIGYHSLTLWTNDVLVAARRIYEASGFQLVAEEKHHSFGKDLTGQTWTLAL